MTDQSQDQSKQDQEKQPKRFIDPAELDGLPEAGGVIYGKLFRITDSGQVLELTLTARGKTAAQAIDNFMDGCSHGLTKYKLTGIKPDTGLPAPAASSPAANQAPPPQVAPPANPGNVPPNPANSAPPISDEQSAGGSIYAVKLDFSRKPDGRFTAGFYAAGHQYADISTVRSAEDICKLIAPLGAFTPAHILDGATYNVKAKVDWVPGKLNGKGKPYKDIVNVSAY